MIYSIYIYQIYSLNLGSLLAAVEVSSGVGPPEAFERTQGNVEAASAVLCMAFREATVTLGRGYGTWSKLP